MLKQTIFSLILLSCLPSLSIGQNETVSLKKYRQQLGELRKEFRAVEMPDVKFFLFGPGNRTKLLYKNGKLINALNGKMIFTPTLVGLLTIFTD